ncbi:TetR/AcrR family transcriptional regulator [Deferrisoma palaeochoriense]
MNRRQAILRAAIELFAERGYGSTPTSEIAKRAGVAEGTIFHHFRNKEGVLREILLAMLDDYIRGGEEEVGNADSGMEGVEKLIRFHFRFTQERAREFRVVLRDVPHSFLRTGTPFAEEFKNRFSRMVELLRRCIERGREDGSIRDVPSEETAFILRGMLYGISRHRLLGPLEPPPLEAEVAAFCRRSLAATA